MDHPLDPPLLVAEHFKTKQPQYFGHLYSSNFHIDLHIYGRYLVALLSLQSIRCMMYLHVSGKKHTSTYVHRVTLLSIMSNIAM